MPINLKLSPEEMMKLFPDAKEGQPFETTVEGTFKMEGDQLVPYVESVEGQPLSAPMAEGSEKIVEEALSEAAPESEPMMEKPAMPLPKDKAKADLTSSLAKLREGKPKEKYM